jgi:DNA polymerase III alpha subunit
MVYQEQAMFLAREMANLDWLEVDKLRKGISKKSGKQFDEACENFARKASERGISNEVIKEVLQLMSKFGGYAFNKSHACMYAIVAYWTAYFKTYYPAEWMAACIEADKDDTDKLDIYIRECERLGVRIKEPNVSESDLTTTVSEDGLIYLPITSLKGVGLSGNSIVENKPYTSLDDFSERSGCNKSLFVALAAGGALKCLVDDPEVDEEFEALRAADIAELEEENLKKEAEELSKALDFAFEQLTGEKLQEGSVFDDEMPFDVNNNIENLDLSIDEAILKGKDFDLDLGFLNAVSVSTIETSDE